jgi:hypothetical protein
MSLRIKMIAAAVAMVASVGANAAVQNAAGQITATAGLPHSEVITDESPASSS